MNFADLILRDDRASQPVATAVPDGTLYYVTDENVTERSNGTTWEDFTDAGGSGGGTTAQTQATRPAAGNDGNLSFPTDGFYIERDNSSIWQPWGPIYPMTQPVNGDFAWVNQGGATVDATKGGVTLWAPANGSTSWRIRKKAAPATPYVITAAFLPLTLALSFQRVAMLFRQSSDGKIATAEFSFDSLAAGVPKFDLNKYSDHATFSAAYTSVKLYPFTPVWFRIADTGTDRTVSYSVDGKTWWLIHTVGRTDYLTADEVGFGADPNNGTYGCGMTLLSWVES